MNQREIVGAQVDPVLAFLSFVGMPGAFCYKPFMRRIDLFLGFFKLGALAFGGTGPLSRAIIVDDRRWLDDAEFAALLGLCQALPGANTCNLAVMLGDRFHGAVGAALALAGLLTAPLAILVAVASFFTTFATFSDVRAALFGATAAAAGLAIGTAVKMTIKVRFDARIAALAAAAFAGSAILRLPLPLILAILVPASFLLSKARA
jgi:chromate transporter